jgi:hypothetical protein
MALRRLHAVAVSSAAGGEPLPIGGPPEDCGNESGCICRGATLANGIDLALFVPLQVDLLIADTAAAQFGIVPVEFTIGSGLYDDLCSPPQLSGRILRAHLSSLVI